MTQIRTIQEEIHHDSIAHGWWPEGRNIGECIALIHSEASEALECWRDDDMNLMFVRDKRNNFKPIGFPSELADIIIRVLDLAGALGIDLDSVITTKVEYNKTRTFRHGGKQA